MPRVIADWLPQLAWFVAGVFATGAFWYFLSQRDYLPTVGAGIGTVVFVGLALFLHTRKAHTPHALREQLAKFLAEAQQLRTRLDEVPLPVNDHNEWVNRVGAYLEKNLGNVFVVRFSDFSGMVFYGSGSEKSKMSNSLEGRSRRLHDFISELK